MSTETNTLSTRAQEADKDGGANLIWDVLRDLWDPSSNPGGYVNVGVAENTLMHDQLLKYMNKPLDLPREYLTYNEGGGGSSRLRRALCQFLNRHLHPVNALEPDQLLVTNGVSSAIEHTSWAFADHGEGILLGRPHYGAFVPDITERPRSTVVPVNFDSKDPFSMEAVSNYEDALLEFQKNTGKKVRALMLCSPHNPLGRCYPRDVIIALMRLCQKYSIHFISDEIYALSVWENKVDEHPPPVKYESALSIDLNGIIDPRLVHVLWGLSKDFGANGIRLGVIISQSNKDFHRALKAISLYSYSSGISEYVASRILDDDSFTEPYVMENQKKLADSYALAAKYVKSHGIDYAPGCNAAFFLWVNLGKRYRELHPDTPDEEEVGDKCMDLLLKHRVFLASGAVFGSERDGWFRIVFSHPQAYLEEALKRIVAAIEE